VKWVVKHQLRTKPFDDEPFDAGIEADEDADPKKYIEQLTGKLGQSLRKYNDSKRSTEFRVREICGEFFVNNLQAKWMLTTKVILSKKS
jgi:hypothetical protein